jgi:hypothetical protein
LCHKSKFLAQNLTLAISRGAALKRPEDVKMKNRPGKVHFSAVKKVDFFHSFSTPLVD